MADISKSDEPANKVKDPVPVHGISDKPNGEQVSRVGTDMRTPDGPEEKRRATETEEKRRQWWKPTREWAAITISIAALCVSFGSCYNSDRSANIAESVFRITQSNERPWVSVKVRLPDAVVFSKEGNLGLEIGVDVRDVGRAVALDMTYWAELVFLNWSFWTWMVAISLHKSGNGNDARTLVILHPHLSTFQRWSCSPELKLRSSL